MRPIETLHTALCALRRNITRAALSALGIIIGVAAAVTMMEIRPRLLQRCPADHQEHGRQQSDGDTRHGCRRRG